MGWRLGIWAWNHFNHSVFLKNIYISTTKICGEYLQKPYNIIKLSVTHYFKNSKTKLSNFYLHSTSYLERQRYFCERMIKATQSTKRLFCIFDNVRDIWNVCILNCLNSMWICRQLLTSFFLGFQMYYLSVD